MQMNYSSKKALNKDQVYANSSNNLENHVKKVKQDTNDVSTIDNTTSGAGDIDQVLKTKFVLL